jgi:hypothetical protein
LITRNSAYRLKLKGYNLRRLTYKAQQRDRALLLKIIAQPRVERVGRSALLGQPLL